MCFRRCDVDKKQLSEFMSNKKLEILKDLQVFPFFNIT